MINRIKNWSEVVLTALVETILTFNPLLLSTGDLLYIHIINGENLQWLPLLSIPIQKRGYMYEYIYHDFIITEISTGGGGERNPQVPLNL